ncbi:MAG: tRNA pseudouridine(55) synthase TruB [Akkermansiaceae bacterium]|nr:tRNA pseudouridine(55) synthase TruB [Armatimonadota bacterium]
MPSVDGIVNIHKPAGMTSHDVVARVRRVLKTKRVGHAGTLDPDATGVLVVAVGQATRLLPYLPLEPKVYIARAVFGSATTSEDASGVETESADASALAEEILSAAIPQFIGDIQQIPPMVSAVHHEGKRLYELARAGITVERDARPAKIFDISLSDFTPGARAEATLHVSCGSGTYIRTLCADLGKSVGLPAHMKTLVRTAVGHFTLGNAVGWETLTPDALVPMEAALDFPTVSLTDDAASDILMGRAVRVDAPSPPAPNPGGAGTQQAEPLHSIGERTSSLPAPPGLGAGGLGAEPSLCLLHNSRLLALARYNAETGTAQPFKVFPLQDQGKSE